MNKEEAMVLIGKQENINGLLKQLQKHAKIVVITNGKKGAFAYDGSTKYTVIPKDVEVVETTGAGDSFAAGLVAGIIIKGDLEYGLKLGAAEANSVIQHIGAKNKLLTLKEANSAIKSGAARILKK